jgi:hypothetical protein
VKDIYLILSYRHQARQALAMTADELARTIQLILAPVVMITACAITLGALINHYQAVNDRLRAMTHERLELLRGKLDHDNVVRERLKEIDHQVPVLLRRHRLVRNAVLAIDTAIVDFVACMLGIAVATISGSPIVAIGALGLFLLGTLIMLAGVVLSAIEIAESHDALAYEARRVESIKPTNPPA